MNPDNLPAILFIAAALSASRRLDHQARARIISHVGSFDIHAEREAEEGLVNTFRLADAPLPAKRFLSRAVSKAADLAEKWIEQGIGAIVSPGPDNLATQTRGLLQVLFTRGDLSLLQGPIASVLNSRKSRGSASDGDWLPATKSLVGFALEQGFTVASSYGNTAYSLTTCLAKGFPTVIVCDDVLPFMAPESRFAEFLSSWGDLFDCDCTLFLSPFPPGTKPGMPVRFVLRDHVVAALATVLLVADVRPGGNMALVIEAARKRGITIGSSSTAGLQWRRLADFVVPQQIGAVCSIRNSTVLPGHQERGAQQPVESRAATRGMIGSTHTLSPGEEPGENTSGFLFHYTRSCPGPWPGQTMAQYCRSLIEGRREAAHTALDTLMHILSEGVIRGSSRLTRGRCPLVSFTECDPSSLQGLIKWRTGLIRWSFEPYGIGIRRDALLNRGAGQVVYGDETVYKWLPVDSKHLFQFQSPARADWVVEKEWRTKGDLLLDGFEDDDLVIVVPTCKEAETVARAFGRYWVLCLEMTTQVTRNMTKMV